MSAIEKAPRRGLIVLGLLIATLAVGAWSLDPLARMSDRGVGIIEFELGRTADKATGFYEDLGPEGRDAGRESLYIDYLYLVLYGLTYAAACVVVASRAAARGMAGLARLGRPLAGGALVAAAFDAIENAALLTILDGHTSQPWPGIAFTFASMKFVLLAAASLYVVAGFLLTLTRRA